MDKQAKKAGILLLWLAVWQIAALWTDNPILLAGPATVLRSFVHNALQPDFLVTLCCSLARIGLGFFAALLAGLLFGALSCRFSFLEELLEPAVQVLKSVPVASFVVLLLIWFGSGRLSFLISFLIVFPNVYVNTAAGLQSVDVKMLEMAEVFGIGSFNRFFYIYKAALAPYLMSCLKVSLGMSWKSGVAAEVIGLPEHSLGERLYMSKIYLDTAGLFAWTLTIVLASFLFEKAVLWLIGLAVGWKPYPGSLCLKRERGRDVGSGTAGGKRRRAEAIEIFRLGKSYGNRQVFLDCSMTMQPGGRYLLMAPSGAGKTTLLRILTGLEKAEQGEITGMPKRVGMVFQEDRLCEDCDALCNILLGMGGDGGRGAGAAEHVRQEAARLLPKECLTEPVNKLSGGMRRRVALLRAILPKSEMLILDEPFAGLDEESRIRCAAYILENLKGRTLLVTTHQEEDVKLLQGVKVTLPRTAAWNREADD